MTKTELIAQAAALGPFSPQTARDYEAARELLAADLNRALGSRPDLEALVGPGNREMMEQNHRNHALFISSLLLAYSPAVLVETVLWVFRAYLAHGFHPTYWAAQLDTWLQVLPQRLTPASCAEAASLYRWLLVNIPHFTALSQAEPATSGESQTSIAGR